MCTAVCTGVTSWMQHLLALHVCALLWGTQHAVIKSLVVSSYFPSLINTVRFTLGAFALCLAASCQRSGSPCESGANSVGSLLLAAELAVWQTLGFTLQLFGLRWTTATRSAILLYLNAPLVPLIARLLDARKEIGRRTWCCALMALGGALVVFLSEGGSNVGDAWSLGAALASAMYIICLGRAMERGQDAARLSAATLAFTSLGSWAVTFVAASQSAYNVFGEVTDLLGAQMLQLLYLSVAVTALSGWLQAYGQERVPPEQAAIVYTLDAAYAPLFSWMMLGEHLQVLGWLGVALIVGSNLLLRLPLQQGAQAYSDVEKAEIADGNEMPSSHRPLLGRGTCTTGIPVSTRAL